MPTTSGGVYAASRVKRAGMWKNFRSGGAPIISTWIDEAGEGESASMSGLWERICKEVAECSRLVFFADPEDFPLKGALVEVGLAMAMMKPIIVCLPGVQVDKRSDSPVGSWIHHPLVLRNDSIDDVMKNIIVRY